MASEMIEALTLLCQEKHIDELVLQRPLALLAHRSREAGAVAESAVQRPLADPRLARHGIHGHVAGAVAREQLVGCSEDPAPVAGRIGPLRRR